MRGETNLSKPVWCFYMFPAAVANSVVKATCTLASNVPCRPPDGRPRRTAGEGWAAAVRRQGGTARECARRLRLCAAEPKEAGLIPAAAAVFQAEARSENALASRFRRALKIPGGRNQFTALHYGAPYSPGLAPSR